jgi:hypothetical protein
MTINKKTENTYRRAAEASQSKLSLGSITSSMEGFVENNFIISSLPLLQQAPQVWVLKASSSCFSHRGSQTSSESHFSDNHTWILY